MRRWSSSARMDRVDNPSRSLPPSSPSRPSSREHRAASRLKQPHQRRFKSSTSTFPFFSQLGCARTSSSHSWQAGRLIGPRLLAFGRQGRLIPTLKHTRRARRIAIYGGTGGAICGGVANSLLGNPLMVTFGLATPEPRNHRQRAARRLPTQSANAPRSLRARAWGEQVAQHRRGRRIGSREVSPI